MAYLRARLTEQSTHTSVALAAVLVLTARAAGIDLTELLNSATGLLTALASASLAAKALLPDPAAPPASPISEAAGRGLERLAAALETRDQAPRA
jgi:hypothetical protein